MVLEVIFISFCCFLLYFIGSFFLDHLLCTEFSLQNTLISSTVFALLWAFIGGYKIAKNGYYFKRFAPKNDKTSNKQNFASGVRLFTSYVIIYKSCFSPYHTLSVSLHSCAWCSVPPHLGRTPNHSVSLCCRYGGYAAPYTPFYPPALISKTHSKKAPIRLAVSVFRCIFAPSKYAKKNAHEHL